MYVYEACMHACVYEACMCVHVCMKHACMCACMCMPHRPSVAGKGFTDPEIEGKPARGEVRGGGMDSAIAIHAIHFLQFEAVQSPLWGGWANNIRLSSLPASLSLSPHVMRPHALGVALSGP